MRSKWLKSERNGDDIFLSSAERNLIGCEGLFADFLINHNLKSNALACQEKS
ncbi:hypothetical protein MD588_17870 [Photobacterium sp. SDRW27]|uniref:hypothetical protein n=1 Tax=Photobacterium obscurum TaxID=2829490 RepID=UPI002244CCC7|nr:hypothetical protein [Photobacterium obscurum]MCW8330661.1 hypothetical protein [Photobacterium obscurum]